MHEQLQNRDPGIVLRNRGVVLSGTGMERFLAARRHLERAEREARDGSRFTLERCAARAKVGLRTLTRCLSGERVDRRSVELIFRGVGLELGSDDLSSR